MKKYIVKLGGSVITNKEKAGFPVDSLENIIGNFEDFFRRDTVNRLVDEIQDALKKDEFSLVLLNGAGPFGHALVEKYRGTNEEYSNLIHASVEYLNQETLKIFRDRGLETKSYAPFNSCRFADGDFHLSDMWNLMQEDIKAGKIPSSYGDGVPLGNHIGVGAKEKNRVDRCVVISADDIALGLNRLWMPDKIIMVSDTDYVASANPGVVENPLYYKEILLNNNYIEVKAIAKEPEDIFEDLRKKKEGKMINRTDVTGGMIKKTLKLITAVKETSTIGQIINGYKSGQLTDSLLGNNKIGTLISKSKI